MHCKMQLSEIHLQLTSKNMCKICLELLKDQKRVELFLICFFHSTDFPYIILTCLWDLCFRFSTWRFVESFWYLFASSLFSGLHFAIFYSARIMIRTIDKTMAEIYRNRHDRKEIKKKKVANFALVLDWKLLNTRPALKTSKQLPHWEAPYGCRDRVHCGVCRNSSMQMWKMIEINM